jgi:2-polyprenyl-3-methyl-5-hydroxy-6-metoxy-1,4-benzoquinol methylase
MDLNNREPVNCPLCDKNNPHLKHRINSWSIVQCTHCNLIYVNPRLHKKELIQLYNENYFDNEVVGYVNYKDNKQLRTKNFLKWINDASGFFNEDEVHNALDIGCAAGYCLEIFKDKGWKPVGVELNKEYAAQLSKNGYTVHNMPFLDVDFKENFEIITLFDVAEHLTDLKSHFIKLHSILSANGVIIIITPDYNSLQRKLFGTKWFQFKPIEHIHYFTLNTFRKLADATGFSVVKSKRAGQFSNVEFLNNRLQKYKLGYTIPFFNFFVRVFNLKNKDIYTDTASLYLVLKKN